jgi:hypothetical protein
MFLYYCFWNNTTQIIGFNHGRMVGGGEGGLKQQLLAGASNFYCAIWLSTNDVIFNKAPIKSFL